MVIYSCIVIKKGDITMKNTVLKRLLAIILIVTMAFPLASCAQKQLGVNVRKETVSQKPSEKESESDIEKESEKESESATDKETEKETEKETSKDGYTKPVFSNGTKTSTEFTSYCTEYLKKAVTKNLIDFHFYIDDPTKFGITSYDKTLGTVDLTKLNDTSEITKDLNALKEFNYSALTPTQQQTYDIIYDALNVELKYSKYSLYSFTFGKSFGIQANLPVLLAEYNLRNENDVIEYLNLLNGLPNYYQNLIAVENVRIKEGLGMSDELINGVISQCKSFVEKPEENYLIVTFNDRLDKISGLTDAKKNEYKLMNKDAVANSVIPSYNYLIKEFNGMLGKGPKTGGITNYKNYKEYFEYILKSSVGTNKTPDQVNSLLKKYALTSSLKLNQLVVTDSNILKNMEAPKYPVTEPSKIIEDLRKKIKNDFPEVPDVTCNIHTVHPSLSAFLSPAFYITSPIDNSSIQNIYINNGASSSFSGLYPTIAHEGYPGHLYQNLYYANTKHEYIRDIISYTGYSEGWATYVEMKSYSYSGLDTNLATALNAYNVYQLCLYGQMDIGVNYYGWSYDDLASFIKTNFGTDDKEVVSEFYNLFLENPGNYLNYIFGYIEIIELKNAASKELGSKFNEKAFHKFLLDFGPAPFYIINDYMDEWINTQK